MIVPGNVQIYRERSGGRPGRDFLIVPGRWLPWSAGKNASKACTDQGGSTPGIPVAGKGHAELLPKGQRALRIKNRAWYRSGIHLLLFL